VVEIDGLDHLGPEKYARDRARDRALQLAGFRVLRFTNDETAADIARVALMIEHFLTQARN
jgi:very-short-patch-repair endonuclease